MLQQIDLSEGEFRDLISDRKLSKSFDNIGKNEFVLVRELLCIYKVDGLCEGTLELCKFQMKKDSPVKFEKFPLNIPNYEYLCAVNACVDEDIVCVSIQGRAGSGKTLLSLTSAICSTQKNSKKGIIFVKENCPSSTYGLGYLKGTLEEKKEPVFEYLKAAFDYTKEAGKLYYTIDDIETETFVYLLGKTFTNKIVIVDEAQNVTPQQMDLIATRIGKGSKLILVGDNDQNHNKLSKEKSGLTWIHEVLDGSKYYKGIILKETDLRSPFVKEYHERRNSVTSTG